MERLLRIVAEIGKIIKLGLPISVTMVLDSGFFSVIALLMGQLGHIGLAAHQVALNYATLVFMIPVGLSSAIAVRVGQSMGREQVEQARFRGYFAMAIIVVLMVPFSLLAIVVPELVIHVYTRDSYVVPLAVALMMVAAVFVGSFIGFILDNWFDSKPWLTIIFFFAGSAAGILNVIKSAKLMQKNNNKN